MNDSIANNSFIDDEMKPEYDLAKMKCRSNPFAEILGQPLTLSLDAEIVDYFEAATRKKSISCQELIGWYLRDCVANQRQISTDDLEVHLKKGERYLLQSGCWGSHSTAFRQSSG